MIPGTRTANILIGSVGIASAAAIGVLFNQKELALTVTLIGGSYLAKEVPGLNKFYEILDAVGPANRNELDTMSRNCKILGSACIITSLALEGSLSINSGALKASGAFLLFAGLI